MFQAAGTYAVAVELRVVPRVECVSPASTMSELLQVAKNAI